MLQFLFSLIRWLLTWVYYVCLICFAGAMAGVFTHVLFALLFRDNPDLFYFASFGFMNGLKYGGVWAGGAAIVLCVVRARKYYLAKHSATPATGHE